MSALISHEIPGGAGWSARIKAGRTVRFTATAAGANCSLLLFVDSDRCDRLNVPDTLKAQMSARIMPPMVLMSDRGVGLASVTGSSLDWHDCLGGHGLDSHAASHGASSYQIDRNAWKRSARSLLLTELWKHGLTEADLHGCINLFSKLATADDESGTLTWVPDHARAGDWVTLRTELDLLLVCSTVPHPLDPHWSPSAVGVEVTVAEPVGEDDHSLCWRDESARALAAARMVLA